MSDYTHDLAERETAVADGYCPLCTARDAARYRWLREWVYRDKDKRLQCLGPYVENYEYGKMQEALDLSIDAAIAAEYENKREETLPTP